MNRYIITVQLWPRNSIFAGIRIDNAAHLVGFTPDIFEIAPADAELLIREYINSPDQYHQQIAQSVLAALTEWREAIAAEDDELVPEPYPVHVETRGPAPHKESPPYV